MKTPNIDNQNKKEPHSNEENRSQVEALKVENTKITDNLEQPKEIVKALKEKNKN